ncbi:MAG: rod shape-determining protein MreC [Clostridiales bacterium]|nr:rod shape-determining protein MreC [Candidatus Blautia equi]
MKKYLKKLNFKVRLKSKHLLVIMTLLCLTFIITTFASGVTGVPFQNGAAMMIVPFEKSISKFGKWIENISDRMQEKKDLIAERDSLLAQIDSLTEQNNRLILDQEELARLQQMYKLDNEYYEYPKVAARIISKDPGNWYNTFMINKGSDDGIRIDNNVLAGKGLIGIVTDVGPSWALVRSIIDDSSNVSAMTVSTNDNCMVQGDLELINEGKLSFYQLYDIDNKVAIGERIVTSSISEKFVEGLFVGYVSEIGLDTNNLTKCGTIVTPVDFQHLRDVLVITVNKQDQIGK